MSCRHQYWYYLPEYKPSLHFQYSFMGLLQFPTITSLPNFCTNLMAINLKRRNTKTPRAIPSMTDHHLAAGTRAYLNIAPCPDLTAAAVYMTHLWHTNLPTLQHYSTLWPTAPLTHFLHHNSCTAKSYFPWYHFLCSDTTQQMPYLHAMWLPNAKSNSKPHQYHDSYFDWTPHSSQYTASHPSQSPRPLHSNDYTTVLSSIPWYLLLLNGPSHTLRMQPQAKEHPLHLNPNTYLSAYCCLQPKPPRPVILDPTLTINFTTAYLPALATKFREWNRIWHNHSYYPYRTTPQPTTSDKNLLRPP